MFMAGLVEADLHLACKLSWEVYLLNFIAKCTQLLSTCSLKGSYKAINEQHILISFVLQNK